MMFNSTPSITTLWILLFAICREAIASCEQGQYFSNGLCMNCTSCAPNAALKPCTNATDTICSCGELQYFDGNDCQNCTECVTTLETACSNTSDTVCSKCSEFEIRTSGGFCQFDCSKCDRGRCEEDERSCKCDSRYEGTLCDILKPPPASTTEPSSRATPETEGEGNRVVIIVAIVVASIVSLVILIALLIAYVTFTKRSSQNSEDSDESTYSSASINSRTMLTNGSPHHSSNGSLQHNTKPSVNGHRSNILPLPTSWNDNLASAIK